MSIYFLQDTYNYGQHINQFPPKTIKVIREFERIQKKICRHKMSIMFNEICINEEMLPIYIYIYIYICSISSLIHIWQNIINIFVNIFYLFYFLLIISSCRIDFMISDGNWFINLPWLIISQLERITVTWSPTERREIRNYYYSSVFELSKDWPLNDK